MPGVVSYNAEANLQWNGIPWGFRQIQTCVKWEAAAAGENENVVVAVIEQTCQKYYTRSNTRLYDLTMHYDCLV